MAESGAVHVPVLLREVVAALRPERGGVYVDATLGLGAKELSLRSTQSRLPEPEPASVA